MCSDLLRVPAGERGCLHACKPECLRACVPACMLAGLGVFISAHMRLCVWRGCWQPCMPVGVCACACICLRACVLCARLQVCLCVRACMHACLLACRHFSVCACLRACLHAWYDRACAPMCKRSCLCECPAVHTSGCHWLWAPANRHPRVQS